MKVYALREFYRAARKESIKNEELCAVIKRTEAGLVEASLGRFLVKQRLAREGQGKSKGFRVIIFYKTERISVFLHLFAKSSKANLTNEELGVYKALVGELNRLNEEQRTELVRRGNWIELNYGKDEDDSSKRSAAVGSSGREGSPRHRRGR